MDQLKAQGPTGSHQAFQRLFTTSVSWRSKPVPGHPVHEWVTGLPVVCSSHVQPCPAICSTTNSIPWWTERATFECLMDRSIFLDHLDSFSTIFPKPSLAEHRAWSHPLGRWMCTMPKCSSTFSTMVWDPRDALFRTLLLSLPVGYGLKCQVPISYHLLII